MPKDVVDDATHQVVAQRDGRQVRLQCKVCEASTQVQDGEFEKLNDFVDAHRGCVGLK